MIPNSAAQAFQFPNPQIHQQQPAVSLPSFGPHSQNALGQQQTHPGFNQQNQPGSHPQFHQQGRISQPHTPKAANTHPLAPRGAAALNSPFPPQHSSSPQAMMTQPQQQPSSHSSSPMAHPFNQGQVPGRVPTPSQGTPHQAPNQLQNGGQHSLGSSPHPGVPMRPASGQQMHHPMQVGSGQPPVRQGSLSGTGSGVPTFAGSMNNTPPIRSALIPAPGPSSTSTGPHIQPVAPNPAPSSNLVAQGPFSGSLSGATMSQLSPGPQPQLQGHFPPGSGVLRLLQYSEGLGAGQDRGDVEYWRSFVSEFFMPNGVFRLVLWNPASREQKGFEVPTSVLPRYFHTSFVSGLRSSQLTLENPREYTAASSIANFPPPPASTKFLNSFPSQNVTHLVETGRAMFVSSFENGWQVQMVGLLRACFVPFARFVPGSANPDNPQESKLELKLRLESLDYTVHAHTGYIPRVAIQKTKVEQPIPAQVVNAITSSALNGHGDASAKSASDGGNGANASPSSVTVASGLGSQKKPGKKGVMVKERKEKDEKERSKDKEGDRDTSGEKDSESQKVEDEKTEYGTVKEEEENGQTSGDPARGADGNASGHSIMVEKTFLPDYPVNEYGISLRAMRCLEITESVCQLRDLIDFSAREKLGPIDSLRKFATQYRDMQSSRMNNSNTSIQSGQSNGNPSLVAAPNGLQTGSPTSGPPRGSSTQGGNGNLVGGGPGSSQDQPQSSAPSPGSMASGTKRKGKGSPAPSPSPKLQSMGSPSKRPR
ncbi:hypothetical protein IE53DRAFT_369043 [Violaceomyces palustris]|uniref:Uncharacterized protein n=1 Tax=Violaceomyces palustris TaxID=1673888 RepID=A0ACD0NWU3_9BASI|nr:hypothetical protein IE53DRAFT_369043 [Violaceomyces palustris]